MVSLRRNEFLGKATQIPPLLSPLLKNAQQLDYQCKTFFTHNQFPLFYRIWKRKTCSVPEKIVLCIHGLHSHSEKYIIFADRCINKNWGVIGLDIRNHGLSYLKSEKRGDIESFFQLVDDLTEFTAFLREQYPSCPLHICAESMGAGLSILAVGLGKIVVSSLSLISPAIRPFILTEIGMLQKYFTTRLYSGDDGASIKNKGGGKFSSHSEQYNLYQQLDPLRLKKLTPRYYSQVLKMLKEIEQIDCTNFPPILIFYGSKDAIIDFKGITKIVKDLGTINKELHFIPGGYHELLTDIEALRYKMFKKINRWVEEN